MCSSVFLIAASKKFAGRKVEVISTFRLPILCAEFLLNRVTVFLQVRSNFGHFRRSIVATKATQVEIKRLFASSFQDDHPRNCPTKTGLNMKLLPFSLIVLNLKLGDI